MYDSVIEGNPTTVLGADLGDSFERLEVSSRAGWGGLPGLFRGD